MTSQPTVAAFRPERPKNARTLGNSPLNEHGSADDGQRLQRSAGKIDLAFAMSCGATCPVRTYQAECAKIRFPRQHGGMEPTGVVINTAGGLTGGDQFSVRAALAEGTAATLTTQAAEKVYRSLAGHARVDNCISLGAGARLDWLPQETILFDEAALERRTAIQMAPDAVLTGVEMLAFGRAAMDERMLHGSLSDQWRIWRGGRLIFADATRLDGPIAETLAGPASAADGVAAALLVHVAPDAESRLELVRELLHQSPAVRAGASAYDGLLVARLVASQGAGMRKAVLKLLGALRDGLPPPRAWMI